MFLFARREREPVPVTDSQTSVLVTSNQRAQAPMVQEIHIGVRNGQQLLASGRRHIRFWTEVARLRGLSGNIETTPLATDWKDRPTRPAISILWESRRRSAVRQRPFGLALQTVRFCNGNSEP